MSTNRNSFQGTDQASAQIIAKIFIDQGVSFEYDSPEECADGIRRYQFRAVNTAGECILAVVHEKGEPL